MLVQFDYMLRHQNDIVSLDSRLAWAGILRMTLTQAVRGDLPAYGAVLFALVQEYAHIPKRPDILNLSTGDVYEIKPRRQAQAGIIQVYRTYIDHLNDAISRVPEAATARIARNFKAGDAFVPFPVYPLGRGLVAVVTRPLNGLILYDVIKTDGEIAAETWREAVITSLAFGALAIPLAASAAIALRIGVGLFRASRAIPAQRLAQAVSSAARAAGRSRRLPPGVPEPWKLPPPGESGMPLH